MELGLLQYDNPLILQLWQDKLLLCCMWDARPGQRLAPSLTTAWGHTSGGPAKESCWYWLHLPLQTPLILGLGLSGQKFSPCHAPNPLANLCGGHQIRAEGAAWTTEGMCVLVAGHSPGEGWGGPPSLAQTCCAERRSRQLAQDPAQGERCSQAARLFQEAPCCLLPNVLLQV